MKPSNRATHLVLLQQIPKGLLWMEVQRENGSLQVLSAGLEGYENPEADEGSGESEPRSLKSLLKAVNNRLKLGWMTRREVVAIAPSHRLTARYLDTPPVEEETLGDLVGFEVSEALQVPLTDIAWDLMISSQHGKSQEKKLLWIAARREYIDGLLGEWPEDRLFPTQLTPDFWGYYEYLLEADANQLNEPALIITREGERASITIADREAIYLTRSIPLSRPSRFQEDLQGVETEEYALAMEIERTLYYAADRSNHGEPKSMICFGFEGWKLDRLNMVAEGNGLSLARLTKNDVLTSFSQRSDGVEADHLPLLCIAFCQLKLNVAGPNLLDIEKEPVDWKSFIPEAALPSQKFMAIGGTLLAVFLALWIGKNVWFDRAIAKRLNQGEGLIQLANRLQKEETGLRQLARTHIDYAEMFLFLAEKMPNGILVKNLSVDVKTGVELTFIGGNNQQAVELQKTLNESPYFRDLILERSVVEKEGFTIYMKGKLQPAR